jgi:hypothetical protein
MREGAILNHRSSIGVPTRTDNTHVLLLLWIALGPRILDKSTVPHPPLASPPPAPSTHTSAVTGTAFDHTPRLCTCTYLLCSHFLAQRLRRGCGIGSGSPVPLARRCSRLQVSCQALVLRPQAVAAALQLPQLLAQRLCGGFQLCDRRKGQLFISYD